MTRKQLRVGDTASVTRTITDDHIRAFADLVGDHNPVHLDDHYARTTAFGGRIAHGMLGVGLISGILGETLPGPGTLYLGQNVRFLKPVRPGDTVTARVTVIEVREDKPIVRLRTECLLASGELVIDGEAVVKIQKATSE